jgi:hypothetical protein
VLCAIVNSNKKNGLRGGLRPAQENPFSQENLAVSDCGPQFSREAL